MFEGALRTKRAVRRNYGFGHAETVQDKADRLLGNLLRRSRIRNAMSPGKPSKGHHCGNMMGKPELVFQSAGVGCDIAAFDRGGEGRGPERDDPLKHRVE